MGQVLKRVHDIEKELGSRRPRASCTNREILPKTFPNLSNLPPELGLLVLSKLNATDLCLAACVWQDLANDEILWQGLCLSQWGYVSAYRTVRRNGCSYKKLYLELDEATLTFNADADLGMEYFFKHHLVEDNTVELARFLHMARHLDATKKQEFLDKRRDVLEKLVELQNFENQFLPNALRKFFNETRPPNERGSYLHMLVEKFSERFCTCNPMLGLEQDTVYVVCFSLIMLSVDLSSPHVKNKMSKREFIRNTRQAVEGINDEFAGHLYDNIYLIGHVAPQA